MDDESAFLAAVARDPADATARLAYADWLDDRGDPRGEYLRLFCTAAGWHDPTADRPAVIDRLQRLGGGLDRDWKAAVQRGANWRTLLEANRPLLDEDGAERGEEFHFGPPAIAEQLDAAERALGVRLTADVRSLWSEFNGVRYTTRRGRDRGDEPEELIYDIDGVVLATTGDLPEYYNQDGFFDEEYGPGAFKNLLCFRLHDARAWAVCLGPVGEHPAGTVLLETHPGWVVLAASVYDFICHRFTDEFSHW